MRHADHHDGGNRAGLPQIMRNAPISFSLGGKGSRPHIGGMHLDLSDEETAALTQELHDIVVSDRYSFSRRIRTLRAILGKLRTEPVREPLPPLEVYAPPSRGRFEDERGQR
jgi:hypothetical protein